MWLALPFASGFGLWRLAVCCVASLPMDAWLPRGAPTRAPLKPYGHAALHLQRSEYSRVDRMKRIACGTGGRRCIPFRADFLYYD